MKNTKLYRKWATNILGTLFYLGIVAVFIYQVNR